MVSEDLRARGKLLALTRVFLLRVLGKNKVDYQGTVTQILELNKKASMGAAKVLSNPLPGEAKAEPLRTDREHSV